MTELRYRSTEAGSNLDVVNEEHPLPVQVIPMPVTARTFLAASGTASAGAITCTLTGASGQLTHIQGLTISGLGATGASAVAVTITGLASTVTVYVAVPAGATVAIAPVYLSFPVPIPAAAPGNNIVVNVPSFGSGNTSAAASAWGFRTTLS